MRTAPRRSSAGRSVPIRLAPPASTRIVIDEYIVHGAVLVEQEIPVARFDRPIRIADHRRTATRDEHDRFLACEFAREPVLVPLLDPVDEEKPRRVRGMMHAHKLPREPPDGLQIPSSAGRIVIASVIPAIIAMGRSAWGRSAG